MIAPSPVINALVNKQEVPFLINTVSEVTVIKYKFYAQLFGKWDQLDPSWLFLKVANNLPTLVEGVTWVKMQIVEQVGAVVICSPVSLAAHIVLCMNILKDLDPAYWPSLSIQTRGCGAVVCKLSS